MIVDTTGDKVNESWLLLIKKTVEKPSLISFTYAR